MLQLKRKIGQRIIIENDIVLEVIKAKPSEVVLGFDFPDGRSVFREEKFIKMSEEKVFLDTMELNKVIYIGPNINLLYKTAIVQEADSDDRFLLCQFDDLSLGEWAHNWHEISKTYLKEIRDIE